jgi:hypothetical protein
MRLAGVETQEHAHQLGGIETVALGPPPTAIDLARCRIDDNLGAALVGQPAVQPEAIVAGLVATDDGGIIGQAETAFGLVDLLEQAGQVACPDGAEPRRLSVSDREGELPFAPARLKSQVQAREARGTLDFAGRCHDGLLEKRIDHSTHARSSSDSDPHLHHF